MKKTSVMIEVSEELYDKIVYPYKKKKSFGKLVVQLLDAYLKNDAIYSYINGSLDGLEGEATDKLLKDLDAMASSLSMLDALHNEADSVISNGQKVFNNVNVVKEDTVNEQEVQEIDTHSDDLVSREEVEKIIEDRLNDILNKLHLDTVGGSSSSNVNTPIDRDIVHTTDTSVQTDNRTYIDNILNTEKESTPEEEAFAEDALNDLLSSIGL